MKFRTSTPAITCVMLAMSVGFAANAYVQFNEAPKGAASVVSTTLDFRSLKWMTSRKVVNNNGEEIANVSDLILDRGTGRIEYVVIKTGTLLGLGGRAITIPYTAFRWEATGGKDRYILAHTAEQLKQFAEYTPETWKALKEIESNDKSVLRQKLESDSATGSDPYAGNFDVEKKMHLSGEVTKVERVQTSTFGEQVQITVETSDGSRKVTLGPSWYVNSSAAAPMRGDKVVIETLALTRDPDKLLAGIEYRIGQNELRLRDTDGTPAWAMRKVDSGGRSYSQLYSRYLLLSELPGTKIDCRGNDLGKVHDIIIERSSGAIGFVSVDPNQNFLGIGDTKRMVPWSVAYVLLDGTMRIDASKEMVLLSPETPADLDSLNNGTHADRAYKAFGVPAPQFDVRGGPSMSNADGNQAWSSRGLIIHGIEQGTAKSLEGDVIGLVDVAFANGASSARALKIRTLGNDAADEVILLGPSWYMDNQKPMCKAGDAIKVNACRTTIDGRPYWIAKSVDCKDTRVVLLDDSNIPVWAQP